MGRKNRNPIRFFIVETKEHTRICYGCRSGIQLGQTVVTTPSEESRAYFHVKCFNKRREKA